MAIPTNQKAVEFDHVCTTSATNDYTVDVEELLNNSPEIYTKNAGDLPEPWNRVSDVPSLTRPTSNLIERLLQWSMVDNNEMLDSYTFFWLDSVIADAICLISRVANPKGVEVLLEPNHEAFVYADQDMIYSMAQNLISNAVKFSRKGETVRISSKIDQDMIEISIANTEVGVSQKQLEQLFQNQLFQIDNKSVTTSTSGPVAEGEIGTRTEQLLCHRFTDKNKGKLSVTSGQGTIFTFSLPKVA